MYRQNNAARPKYFLLKKALRCVLWFLFKSHHLQHLCCSLHLTKTEKGGGYFSSDAPLGGSYQIQDQNSATRKEHQKRTFFQTRHVTSHIRDWDSTAR
jgi:hypothetical protein